MGMKTMLMVWWRWWHDEVMLDTCGGTSSNNSFYSPPRRHKHTTQQSQPTQLKIPAWSLQTDPLSKYYSNPSIQMCLFPNIFIEEKGKIKTCPLLWYDHNALWSISTTTLFSVRSSSVISDLSWGEVGLHCWPSSGVFISFGSFLP